MDDIEIAKELCGSDVDILYDRGHLANRNKDVIRAVRLMKATKLDMFKHLESNDRIPEDVAATICGVLNADLSICDLLMETDLDDADAIRAIAPRIKEIIKSSPAPAYQQVYESILDENDASLEYFYFKMIVEIQKLLKG